MYSTVPAQSLQDLKVICSRCYRLSRELADEVLAGKFPKETEPGLEVGQDALCLWRKTGGLGKTFMGRSPKQGRIQSLCCVLGKMRGSMEPQP